MADLGLGTRGLGFWLWLHVALGRSLPPATPTQPTWKNSHPTRALPPLLWKPLGPETVVCSVHPCLLAQRGARQLQETPKTPTSRWMNNMWSLHMMEHYSAMNSREALTHFIT